jgi:hypothetical protein
MIGKSAIATAALLLAGFPPAWADAPDAAVQVYRFDGSRQCTPGSGRATEEDAKALTDIGVSRIVSAQKRRAPGVFIALCGAPTGIANVIGIPKDDWIKLEKHIEAAPLLFKRWLFDSEQVAIFEYTGELQCFGGGSPISVFEKQLTDAHIPFKNPRAGADGLVHVMLCGASSGKIYIFDIDSTQFEAAHRLGFSLLEDLSVLQAARLKKTGIQPASAAMRVDGDDVYPWPW